MTTRSYSVSVLVPALDNAREVPEFLKRHYRLVFNIEEETCHVGTLCDTVATRWNDAFTLEARKVRASQVNIYVFGNRVSNSVRLSYVPAQVSDADSLEVKATIYERDGAWLGMTQSWPKSLSEFVLEWSRRDLPVSKRTWGETADFAELVEHLNRLVLRGRRGNLGAILGLLKRGRNDLLHAALGVMQGLEAVEPPEGLQEGGPEPETPAIAQERLMQQIAETPQQPDDVRAFVEGTLKRWRRELPGDEAQQLVMLVETLSQEIAGVQPVLWEFELLARLLDDLLHTTTRGGGDSLASEILQELGSLRAIEPDPLLVAKCMVDEIMIAELICQRPRKIARR